MIGIRRVWKPLVDCGGPLAAPYLLADPEQEPRPRSAGTHARGIADLQLHDTELTRDILLARAGLLPNYDSLPRIGQQLSRIVDALRAESATVSGAAAQEMRQHAEALTAALQQKLTLVEYFKSDNALLQNSLRYLTYTGQTLGKRSRRSKAVAAEIAALSHVLLRFMHTSELDAGKEAEAALSRLSAHAAPTARSRHADRTWLAH